MTRAPDSSSQQDTLNSPLRTPGAQRSPNGAPGASRPPLTGSSDTNRSTIGNATKAELSEVGHNSESPMDTILDAAFGEVQPSFWKVLQNRNFLFLWAGQVFSQLADKVYLVLMIALITTQFQAEGQTVSGWVSSVMVAFTIPAVLFGSFAGVLVDRWSKKWTMILTNVLRGGLVLVLPLLLWTVKSYGNFLQVPLGFWMVLGVTFLVSTLTQFFAPAEQSTIPLIVDKPQLLSANSLYTFTMMLAVVVGFAAGDPLLEVSTALLGHLPWLGSFSRELVVGGSYAIAGLLLVFLSTNEVSRPQVTEMSQVWADIKDGLRFINAHRRIKAALIQLVILFSIFAALAVLVVRMAEVLLEDPTNFGILLAAGGVGMVVGITVLNRIVHRVSYRILSFCGSLGMGAAFFGLAFTTQHLWFSLELLSAIGVFAALVGVPMQTTMQEQTPEELRGKVFGIQNNAVNIALSLPLALAGVAETFFGLQWVLLSLAALVVTGGLLTWYISGTAELTSRESA
ncbi:MFS transporter [Altericista sp. CCNU0014]|uniref:MFS transporter n=1 Tax=Altericista sp. CCNU0014 TaxID=3082949 RepID=UPI00384F4F28